MIASQLQVEIERHFAAGPAATGDKSAMKAFLLLRAALESGELRSASPDPAAPNGWRVNAWVKQGILLGFRLGVLEDMPSGRPFFRRQAHLPCPAVHRKRRNPRRSRRLLRSLRSLRGPRRGLHAAHVHQCRGICGRGHDGRLARAGRLLRADRQACSPRAPRHRSAAC